MSTSLLALLACAQQWGQTPGSPELQKAEADAARVRRLVEAGALPKNALAEAELVLAEVSDEATLKRTLYGRNRLDQHTEKEIGEMMAAAERLVRRQEQERDKAELLVREGVIPKTALAPYQQEIERRRRTLELARKKADLFQQLVEMIRIEEELIAALDRGDESAARLAERYDGNGVFLASQFDVIKLSYEREFHEPLPVSAEGDTALHRSLGYDHRGRVDVAVHPDTSAGKWLRERLEQMRIPYFAFRAAAGGRSTGAHIHIGPPSLRLRRTD